MQMSSSAFASAHLHGPRCLCSTPQPAYSRRSLPVSKPLLVNTSQRQQGSRSRRPVKVQAQRAVLWLDRSKEAQQISQALHQDVVEDDKQAALLATAPVPFEELKHLYLAWNLSVQLSTPPPRSPKTSGPGGKDDEFYANVGNAIRTLREEIPLLFQQDFTCESTLPFLP